MAKNTNLTMCSFCGKSHSEVKKLIAGPGVYICNECINVCSDIMQKELANISKDSGDGDQTRTLEALLAEQTLL